MKVTYHHSKCMAQKTCFLTGLSVFTPFTLFLLALTLFTSCKQESNQTPIEQLQSYYTEKLDSCVMYLDSLQRDTTLKDFKRHFLQARKYFKLAEPILAAVDKSNYKYLNQPNIIRVEEDDFTDIKVYEPTGFQVLEEEIYGDTPNFTGIQKHAKQTHARTSFVRNNANILKNKPYHILWWIRDAIQRVAFLGITGFDSPMLEQSLKEGEYVYTSLRTILFFYQENFSDPSLFKKWNTELNATFAALQGSFEEMNRYDFIKHRTQYQIELWNQTVKNWNIQFPLALALNNDAPSLFSKNTFNLEYFSDYRDPRISDRKVTLGKMLFHDPSLSSSGKMSCATCHLEHLAFTDGRKTPENQIRNTPTLLYAALQKSFFHDGRAGGLEGQIVHVLRNRKEFHSDLKELVNSVSQNAFYAKEFSDIYPEGLHHRPIRNAIADYIRTLISFNSKFDKNINGIESTFTPEEVRGFNLFMGKAKCATCHFPPMFNGTVPSSFRESELEHLGTPSTKDTIHAVIDKDPGRYNIYNTPERKHFFKTPTIRNVALTAPYMHNGVYDSLEEVIDFYNRGGGAGIGIEEEFQTLPPDPLNLSQEDFQALTAFMETLTDSAFSIP